jgi:hypothetical protein
MSMEGIENLQIRILVCDEKRILDALAALKPRPSLWQRVIAWFRS